MTIPAYMKRCPVTTLLIGVAAVVLIALNIGEVLLLLGEGR